MATKIFINLPVNNLSKSVEFFKSMGFSFNAQFTDETAACMVVSEDIYAMLLTHQKFGAFTNKQIADAQKITEVITALSMDSREEVNNIAQKALDSGGVQMKEPFDYGFMYGRSINDLDGHIWEFFWMDPTYVQQPESETVSTN